MNSPVVTPSSEVKVTFTSYGPGEGKITLCRLVPSSALWPFRSVITYILCGYRKIICDLVNGCPKTIAKD